MVGSGYTARELCDFMSLASPGRWSPHKRNFPSSPAWKAVASPVLNFTREHGTTDLLMALALRKVKTSPFPRELVARLKEQTVETLCAHGLSLDGHPEDRRDVPIDFRYLGLLLRAAGDRDVHIGDFATGVRVGPGARLTSTVLEEDTVEAPRTVRPTRLPRGEERHSGGKTTPRWKV